MQINSQEWPEAQISATWNMTEDGRILSRSIMVNLRNSKVSTVWSAYEELKSLIDDKENKAEEKVKNNPRKEKKPDKIEQQKDENTCPVCGAMLVEKSGISKKNGFPFHFWGCSNFQNGCKFSKPFISGSEKHVQADEDLIDISAIPF